MKFVENILDFKPFKQKLTRDGFGAIGILAIVASVLVLLVLAGIGYFAYQRYTDKRVALPQINSFEDCVKAGYQVAESYPRQCYTPDGKRFVEPVEGGAIDTSTWKTYPSTGSTSSPQAGSGQAATDTSDWKVYRNEKYGFEVRYPSNFRIFSFSGEDKWHPPGYIFSLILEEEKYKNAERERPFMAVSGLRRNFMDESFIKNIRSRNDEVSGYPWVLNEKVILSESPKTYELVFGEGNLGDIYVLGNIMTYEISWYGNANYKDTAEKIFSSFKMLKP